MRPLLDSRAGAVVALLALLSTVAAQATGEEPEKVVYAVVQVDDEFQIVAKDQVDETKDRIDSEYDQEVESWKSRQADARKAKAKFTEKKPKKPKVKVVGASFDSRQEAEEHVAKLRAKLQRSAGGKGDYLVVAVDDEPRIIRKAELAELRKELADRFKEATAEHQRAKKAAQKAKEEFDEPAPKRPVLKQLGAFDDEAEAKAFVEKRAGTAGDGKGDKGGKDGDGADR